MIDFVGFFNRVIKDNLKVSFFFPTALKGDLLTKETIDTMMQGGAVGVNVSLESASPRMQKVMRKNLDIELDKTEDFLIEASEGSTIFFLNSSD